MALTSRPSCKTISTVFTPLASGHRTTAWQVERTTRFNFVIHKLSIQLYREDKLRTKENLWGFKKKKITKGIAKRSQNFLRSAHPACFLLSRCTLPQILLLLLSASAVNSINTDQFQCEEQQNQGKHRTQKSNTAKGGKQVKCLTKFFPFS